MMAMRRKRHTGPVKPDAPQPSVEQPSKPVRSPFKNPGRVVGRRAESGLPALRDRLKLSARVTVDEVADTALALIAELEAGPNPLFPPDRLIEPKPQITL